MSCDCDCDCDCGPSVVLALPSDEVVFASLTLIARSESLRSERTRLHACISITTVCMRKRSAVTHPPIEAAAAAESPSMPSTSLRSSAWKLADEDEDEEDEDEDGAKGSWWGCGCGLGCGMVRVEAVSGKADGCGAEWNRGKWKPPPSDNMHMHIHTYTYTLIGIQEWLSCVGSGYRACPRRRIACAWGRR